MRDVALDREGYQRHLQEQEILRSSAAHSRPPTTARHHPSPHSHGDAYDHTPTAASQLAYYEVIEEMGRLLEGDSAASLEPTITKLKIYPPKPMVLFPALPANVRIFFTVSEVRPSCSAPPSDQCPLISHFCCTLRSQSGPAQSSLANAPFKETTG
jgi:hypothetical protein